MELEKCEERGVTEKREEEGQEVECEKRERKVQVTAGMLVGSTERRD